MDSPFPSQCSLLIPLKTSENLWFSDVSRGIKRKHWEEKDYGNKTSSKSGALAAIRLKIFIQQFTVFTALFLEKLL